jgi:monomeric sarcosine oxidase
MSPKSDHYDTVVVGAGVLGGWTALFLTRMGQRVLLVDAWGPGNSRSSSGGETRVLRSIYGGDAHYVGLVVRAVRLWREAEQEWGQRVYQQTGALWMCSEQDDYVRCSLDSVRDAGFRVEELSLEVARRRFPQVSFDGIQSVFVEQEAGFLLASRACRNVWNAVVRSGGTATQLSATPGRIEGGGVKDIALTDGSRVTADCFVFATGAWLVAHFPHLLADVLTPTRQEVFFFGTPAGDVRFASEHFPVWVELGTRIMYGVPDQGLRGFKIGDDTRGPRFDPTAGDRTPSQAGLDRARTYLARRFPDMKGAPLLEARVCQYTNTPDGHLVVDRLPGAENVWIVGGRSGHSFKLGPAIGQDVASKIISGGAPESVFALDRLEQVEQPRTQFQHVVPRD